MRWCLRQYQFLVLRIPTKRVVSTEAPAFLRCVGGARSCTSPSPVVGCMHTGSLGDVLPDPLLRERVVAMSDLDPAGVSNPALGALDPLWSPSVYPPRHFVI